ncbi:tetratricopeptide repeat protein [Alsobacter metallidurans]|uniref:tetratricopeptide repeat protein n=1 Tax=Alsobacter metallidurans TaxID=340221 RepID=UPI001FCEF6F7|nr:SEL1-like repeat protein [Alsobacter metallidurans]
MRSTRSRLLRAARLGAAFAALMAAQAGHAQTTTPETSAPAAPPQPSATPPAPETAAPATPAQPLDVAYGAYQRGLYITAFREATKRIAEDPNDAAAMTLLGELYSAGLGVAQDWTKAAEWYRLAAGRGDPNAAFALAMLKLDGKGTPRDAAEGRRLLESAADAVPDAAYTLGLMLLQENKAESDKRAVQLFRDAADAGDADGEYALAVVLRDGRGVPRDNAQAAAWMGRAARDRNVSAQVEYGIMLFNGDGVRKDETAGAKMFLSAAEQGNPVAQNRLARIYAAGRGLPKNPVEAAKWHAIATNQGIKDPWLDENLKGLSPEDRRKADEAVRKWLGN